MPRSTTGSLTPDDHRIDPTLDPRPTSRIDVSRMTWMDVLRGVAVVAVIVFHAGTLLRYADLEIPEAYRSMNRAVAPFRIPLLVLLSGMLLPRSVAKGARRYLEGKARAILWPYLLWSGVIGLIFWIQYGLASVKWLVPSVLSGGTYLWYLLFLLAFYVVALPLRPVPRLPVAVVFLVLAEVAPDGDKYTERFGFLFALFLIGWWLGDHGEGLRRTLSSWWTPSLALAAVIASYSAGLVSGYGPRGVLATLGGTFLLAWLATRFSDARALRPLRFVGRNSVVFYCVHFPLILALMALGGLFEIDHAAILVAVTTVAALAVATVLARHRVDAPFVGALFVAPRWVDKLFASTARLVRPGR